MYKPLRIVIVDPQLLRENEHFRAQEWDQLLVLNEKYYPYTQWGGDESISKVLPKDLFVTPKLETSRTGRSWTQGWAFVYGTIAIYLELPEKTNRTDERREIVPGIGTVWHEKYEDDKIGQPWDQTGHINHIARKLAMEYNCQRYSCSTGRSIRYIRKESWEAGIFETIDPETGNYPPRLGLEERFVTECTLCNLHLHEKAHYEDKVEQAQEEIEYLGGEIEKAKQKLTDLEQELQDSKKWLKELQGKTPEQVWKEDQKERK